MAQHFCAVFRNLSKNPCLVPKLLKLNNMVILYSGPPLILTKFQVHSKLLYLQNLGLGQFAFIQGLGLSQIKGGPVQRITLNYWLRELG